MRIYISAADMNAPLNPPPCPAFPGGAFARAFDAETAQLVGEMSGKPVQPWYAGVHKGPRRKVRRAAGNLPKRMRKASRKAA